MIVSAVNSGSLYWSCRLRNFPAIMSQFGVRIVGLCALLYANAALLGVIWPWPYFGKIVYYAVAEAGCASQQGAILVP